MFKIKLVSTAIWLGLSAIMALGFVLVSINVALIVFGVVAGMIGFIGYPLNRFIDNKVRLTDIQSRMLTDQEALIASAQSTSIECAYCGEMNKVSVHISNDYKFKCRSCNEISKVVVDSRSCRTTSLEFDDAPYTGDESDG